MDLIIHQQTNYNTKQIIALLLTNYLYTFRGPVSKPDSALFTFVTNRIIGGLSLYWLGKVKAET